jgi:D-alanyl-D-alanine carboxypeptidase
MAIAIAEKIGIDNFIKKMNEKAKALGLNDTYFLNIIDSNSQDEDENSNYSTVFDIAKLFKYLFENRSDLFAILENNEYSFSEIKTGRKIHLKTNANLVLNKNFVAFVLDKKDKKILNNKMNFVIITPAPVNGIIINVVFDSENYFDDISRLLNYIQNSFVWQ